MMATAMLEGTLTPRMQAELERDRPAWGNNKYLFCLGLSSLTLHF